MKFRDVIYSRSISQKEILIDTMAIVIPKELRKTLKLKKGDTLEAKADDKDGLLIYTKM